ncbi:MAG TPA: hypothetical protein VHO02_03760 [Fibrobacteria bacterium]|jgi:hypothetical protein|nr:hypothetical protein [Fibrobacteria bacterium]
MAGWHDGAPPFHLYFLALVLIAALIGIFTGYVTRPGSSTKGTGWVGTLLDAVLGAIGLLLGLLALILADLFLGVPLIPGLLVVLLFGPVLFVMAVRKIL